MGRTMKGGAVTKLFLVFFLPIILVLRDDKGTLAVFVPELHYNSQLPKHLVLDKPEGKKSLIEIEVKTGKKESDQKQTDGRCIFKGKEYVWGETRVVVMDVTHVPVKVVDGRIL